MTLGDPGGIGPEVALRALAAWRGRPAVSVLLLGRAAFFSALARRLRLDLSFRDVATPVPAPVRRARELACYFEGVFPAGRIRLGRSVAAQTRAAVRSIALGVRLAMSGRVDAIVTPPINKAGLGRAGFRMDGHTEYLAELSGSRRFGMMLVGGPLRVVLVTRHVALSKVPGLLTRERVRDAVLLADRELRHSFGIVRPRLVVCGLNPHAGEAGRFGREEIRTIAPGVRAAARRIKGTVVGPLSPDVLFHDAYAGRYDAEICMYHDQGLIPLKMISRGAGVNVTLGLPFVRTSPDHGTAYDIAPRLRADPGSMLEALETAVTLVRNRRRRAGSRRRS